MGILLNHIWKSVLTEFENWVDSKVLQSEQKIMNQFITPIQKETDGIRSEIRMLAETMKHGFEKMDQKWEERFLRMNQKIDFTRDNLENQIKANEKNMEKQFSFQQKLLWAVLSVVLGLFAKAIHLI
jgi:prophage antirepressor-like protein